MDYKINKKRKIGVDILFVFGLFIIIYNPPILMINTMHLVGFVSLLYFVIVGGVKRLFIVKKNTLKLLSGFLAIFFYLLVFACFINEQSISTILFPIYFVIDVIPFGFAMKEYMERNSLDFGWSVSIIINTALLQAVTAIASFLIPNVQRFFVERMVAYGYNEVYTTLSSYRMYGFSNALTNATPVVQSIIAVISVWHALRYSKKYYLYALVLMLSAVINARISIVVFAIGIVILMINSTTSITRKLKIVFIAFIAYFVIIAFILPMIQSVSPLTYEWVTDGFSELSSFKIGVTSYEKNSYFGYLLNRERFALPEGFFPFLFGKGYSIMSSKNPSGFQSDVGYVCDLWTGGLMYVILLYSFFLGLLNRLRKNQNSLISFIAIYYIVALLFINIKGVALSMNAFVNLLVIVVCISMTEYQRGEMKYD